MDDEHTTVVVQLIWTNWVATHPAESDGPRPSSIGPSAGCTNSAPPSCTGAIRAGAAAPQPRSGRTAWRGRRASAQELRERSAREQCSIRQLGQSAHAVGTQLKWAAAQMSSPAAVELRDGLVPAPPSSDSGLTPSLPPHARRDPPTCRRAEREAFDLVRNRGLTQAEAGQSARRVSAATVNRRLNRGLELQGRGGSATSDRTTVPGSSRSSNT